VFIDRELYLPKAWANNEALRAATGIPPSVAYASKPQLMQRMLARALAARVPAARLGGAVEIRPIVEW
jgi:SRSO17 transposase